MLTLFLLEGIWLWAAFGVWALLLGICVYNERYSLATLDVVALSLLLSVTGNFHPGEAWNYCIHNPVIVIGGFLGYLAAGVVWARMKWSMLTSRLKEQVDAWRESNRKTNERNRKDYEKELAEHETQKGRVSARNVTSGEDEFKPKEPVEKTFLNTSVPYELSGKIEVKDDGRLSIVFDRFKSRIMGWIGYWPMSVIIWVVGDFIHDMLEQIVRMIRSHFVFSADRKLNS